MVNPSKELTSKMFIFVVLLMRLQVIQAFQSSPEVVVINLRARRSLTRPSTSTRSKSCISLLSDIHAATTTPSFIEDIEFSSNSLRSMSSIILASDVESWRQYVPLVVSIGVIIDILLGSPLANLALGPMKRASEKGSGETSGNNSDGGNSLFSAFGNANVSKSKERVDSDAIAQAAIDKARNTLELKQFLEENKSNEQRYDEIRRKIDKQMDELDES